MKESLHNHTRIAHHAQEVPVHLAGCGIGRDAGRGRAEHVGLEDEGQVEVLPLLGQQRALGPAQAVLAGALGQARQDDDGGGRAEEDPHQDVLLPGLAAGDEGGQEQARGEQADGGPE